MMKNQPITIHCPPVFDINNVVNQKEIFSQALLAKRNIVFDAKELKRIDTAGLQLLLNFVLCIDKQGLHWGWNDPSPQLLHLAELLGMADLLQLPKKTR